MRQLDGLVLGGEERCLLGVPDKIYQYLARIINVWQELSIPDKHYKYPHFQHDVMMYKLFSQDFIFFVVITSYHRH